MTKNYNIFLRKLNEFITKYHKVELYRSVILGTTLLLLLWLIVSVSNFLFYFSVSSKKIIFAFSLILSALIFTEFFILKLLPLLKIKRLSYKKATGLLSGLQPDLKDKPLNILELAELDTANELVLASIDQKIKSLKILDFKNLITYKSLIKYAKYLIAVCLVIMLLGISNPSVLKEGTKRFLAVNTYYSPPSPIKFVLLNKNLSVPQGENLTVRLKTTGKFIPENVYIDVEGSEYLMLRDKKQPDIFVYTLKNLTQSTTIKFRTGKYLSKTYTVKVIPQPQIVSLHIRVVPPKYTHLQSTEYLNTTTIKIPQGSFVKINLRTKNIDTLLVKRQNQRQLLTSGNNSYVLKLSVIKDQKITFYATNGEEPAKTLLDLSIKIIPDEYPKITVNQFVDSNNLKLFYFVGQIQDDYGFTALTFNVNLNDSLLTTNIPVKKSIPVQPFAFSYDFSNLQLKPGDRVTYYFEVFDNDFIHTFKSTKSQTFVFKLPTVKELSEQLDTIQNQLTGELDKAKELTREIMNDIEKLQTQLLNQNLTDWEKQNILKNIQEKQNELQQLIENAAKKNELINKELNSYLQQSLELMQKRQQIQELLDQLLNDEIKELLKKLEELMKNTDIKDFNKKLNNLKFDYNQLSKRLDQNLELLKRLAIEQNIEQQQLQLKQLADKLDSLSQVTKKRKQSKQELLDQQNRINREFEELKQSYKQTLEENKSLSKPLKLEDFQKQFEQIEQNLQQAGTELNSGKNRKAAKMQKQASEQMRQLSEKMQNMLQSAQMSGNIEDINLLNKLYQDLLEISFSTEYLYNQIKQTYANSPVLGKYAIDLKKIKDQFAIVEDSLNNLAKRNPQINKPVNDQIRKINVAFDNALKNLENRKKSLALSANREIITYTNNLALLLSEITEQMEKMMQNASMSAKGGQKQNTQNLMPDLKQLQQQLQNELEQIIKEMEQAKRKGKKTQINSEQLVKALAEQEQLRKALEQLMENQTLSPEVSKKLNEVKKLLDEVKKDIIYNQITPETLRRQQQIKVKLLEAEKAMKQQGFDEKRKAETAQNYPKRSPNEIYNMYQNKIKQKEILQLNNIKLKTFYKNIYSNYLNSIH